MQMTIAFQPDAVLNNATTVKAVQAVIKYCASSSFKVAVQFGGQSWETSWLHGRGSKCNS
jgi:hypothetical protein